MLRLGLGLVWDGKGKFVVGLSLRLVSSRSAGYMVGSKLDEGGLLAWRMGLQWVYDWFRVGLGWI